MPEYLYHCKECGYKEYISQDINEEPLTNCETCYLDAIGDTGTIGFKEDGSFDTLLYEKIIKERVTTMGIGTFHRVPQVPSIQFKGSGFYVTDKRVSN